MRNKTVGYINANSLLRVSRDGTCKLYSYHIRFVEMDTNTLNKGVTKMIEYRNCIENMM